jgi:hypothetical protein
VQRALLTLLLRRGRLKKSVWPYSRRRKRPRRKPRKNEKRPQKLPRLPRQRSKRVLMQIKRRLLKKLRLRMHLTERRLRERAKMTLPLLTRL